MRSKFTDYASFADAKLEDIFTEEQLRTAGTLEINEMRSVYLENKNDSFAVHPLPLQAQYAPVYAIQVLDYNEDGKLDFILGGNQNTARLRLGVMDANFGQLYEGDGTGGFAFQATPDSGLRFTGDVKSMQLVNLSYLKVLLVGINNQGVEGYLLNRSLDNKPVKSLSNQNK
jgi:hypothetical protein